MRAAIASLTPEKRLEMAYHRFPGVNVQGAGTVAEEGPKAKLRDRALRMLAR